MLLLKRKMRNKPGSLRASKALVNQ